MTNQLQGKCVVCGGNTAERCVECRAALCAEAAHDAAVKRRWAAFGERLTLRRHRCAGFVFGPFIGLRSALPMATTAKKGRA